MIARSASISHALGRDLVHRRRVGDEGAGADLAAGAGCRRNLHQRDGALGRAVRSRNVREAQVARHQDRDELREVHRAAAAEADHRVGIGRLRRGDGGLEVRQVGLGLDVAEQRRVPEAQDVEAGGVHLVGDDEGARAGRPPPIHRASVSTSPAPKRTIAGRCISSGRCRVSMGFSSGDREPAGLLNLRVGIEAGGEQAAGVGLDAGSRRSRAPGRSRRRGPSP